MLVVIILVSSIANAFTFTNLTQWKIEDGGNDHWYGLMIDERLTWYEAGNAASTNVQSGFSGHLATITSQQENEFVFSIIDGVYNPVNEQEWWLGGLLQNSDWTWVTGESWVYSNWSYIQPSGDGDANAIFNTFSCGNPEATWNDLPSYGTLWSIVEWGEPSTANPVSTTDPVPEPSTFILMGIGFVGLVATRIRKLEK